MPGNYIRVDIQGKYLKNVARIPRYLVDNNSFIYTMVNGKLAHSKVDVITIQNDYAIIRNTIPKETEIVKTILQKPLLGMGLKSSSESLKINNDSPNINATTVGEF